MGHAGGSNLWTFRCVNLFRGDTWARDTDLGVIAIKLVVEVCRVRKIRKHV